VRYLAADLGKENIRVNAISAGPMRTLADRRRRRAHGSSNGTRLTAPQKTSSWITLAGPRSICCRLSAGVTGEVHFVDAGYNVVGMPPTGRS